MAEPIRRRSRRGPEVVHVGSACRDVAPDDPRGWRLGGGVTYADADDGPARAADRRGRRGRRAGAAAAAELDLLRDAGADLMLVPLDEGPIYHNVETPAGRVQTCVQPGIPLPIPPLPESWLAAPAWELAPVAGEIGDDWAAAIPADAYLGGRLAGLPADPRRRRAGHPPTAPTASPILARADLVGVSHRDVDPDTPIAALTALLKPGARLVVTRGHEGGLVVVVGGSGPDAVLRYRSTPVRPGARPDRRRRHVPRGARLDRRPPHPRRAARRPRPPGAPVRRRGRRARRRGPGPDRRPGSRGRPGPDGPRSDQQAVAPATVGRVGADVAEP